MAHIVRRAWMDVNFCFPLLPKRTLRKWSASNISLCTPPKRLFDYYPLLIKVTILPDIDNPALKCWEFSYDQRECMLVKSQLSRTSFQMNAHISVSACATHTHTLIHTLTCAFILSQLQPSGTVALIRIQHRGAAMAAVSIVDMTACYLCMKPHRYQEKIWIVCFPGLYLYNVDWCVMNITTQMCPSSSSTRPDPHSQRQEPLVFTHTSAQPPFPFPHSLRSENRTHTTAGSDIIIRWALV